MFCDELPLASSLALTQQKFKRSYYGARKHEHCSVQVLLLQLCLRSAGVIYIRSAEVVDSLPASCLPCSADAA